MNDSLERFLNDSVVAETVKLVPRIVVQRTALTPQDLLDIRDAEHYGLLPAKELVCEFEVGGQMLARGKIIKRRGEFYFKILETYIGEVLR